MISAMSLMTLLISAISSSPVTLHLIGDSTMANQDEAGEIRGWGQMFQQFFNSDLTVNNRAKSGASSKTFYEGSAYWETVKKEIKPGDYVIIQFGHNDEKHDGVEGDIGTAAQGTYKTYLKAFVNETRSLGGIPVLATPICRRFFSGESITRRGQHDLGENFNVPESDHTYDYPFAMKEVADELSVKLIDLTALTKELYESYGDTDSKALLFTESDATHPSALGATLIGRLCAQEMTAQDILTDYINSSADLLINPVNHDFGKAYIGQQLTKEFTISGFDLTPESGTVTLSVSEGFTISMDKGGEGSSSINMDYSNGNVDFSRFYLSVSSEAAGVKTGTLEVATGTVNKSIPLSASFIELTGGTEVEVKWELSENAAYVLAGPAMAIDQSHSKMYAQRYAQPNSNTLTESENWDVNRKMQRNLIEGDTWPDGDIDEVPNRYIQFGITANQGTDLNIDEIELFVAGAGGSGMNCRISYSTNNFSDYKVVEEFKSMTSNTVYEVSHIPVEKLSYGDTLLLRIYPWYDGAATGKTICIADVTIHGVAVPESDKEAQTITFGEIAAKKIGDAPFDLSASSTSGLAVSFLSSNPKVATIEGKTVTIVGGGITDIAATQAGDEDYDAATNVTRVLTVSKMDQSITFDELATANVGGAPIDLSASSTSGLDITYTSSNTSVAIISNGQLVIQGAGTTDITASQPGNDSYEKAADVVRTLSVVGAPLAVSPAEAVGVSIYPNPGNEILYIKSEDNWIGSKVLIYNTAGQVLQESRLGADKTIDLRGLNDGLYVIEMIRNERFKTLLQIAH